VETTTVEIAHCQQFNIDTDEISYQDPDKISDQEPDDMINTLPASIRSNYIIDFNFSSLHDHCNTPPSCQRILHNCPGNFPGFIFCKIILVKGIMLNKLMTQMGMFPCLFVGTLSLVISFLDNMH
jgi:hypothetical protein